jgi:hypothetical protein
MTDQEQVGQDPVLCLFKIGERVNMEELVREGHLYMLPLSHFVRMEADQLRADRNEGLIYTMPAYGAKLHMKLPGALGLQS